MCCILALGIGHFCCSTNLLFSCTAKTKYSEIICMCVCVCVCLAHACQSADKVGKWDVFGWNFVDFGSDLSAQTLNDEEGSQAEKTMEKSHQHQHWNVCVLCVCIGVADGSKPEVCLTNLSQKCWHISRKSSRIYRRWFSRWFQPWFSSKATKRNTKCHQSSPLRRTY